MSIKGCAASFLDVEVDQHVSLILDVESMSRIATRDQHNVQLVHETQKPHQAFKFLSKKKE